MTGACCMRRGRATWRPVDLTAGTTYMIAENDFMANAGDGYPNFSARMTSQDIMEEVVADYITANSALRSRRRSSAVVPGASRARTRTGDGAGLPDLVPSP